MNPLSLTDFPARIRSEGPRLQGVRVLVADDDPTSLLAMRHVLVTEGAQVVVAADGLQALEAVERAECAFDVVVMDLRMPVMDGLEATRRIRAIRQTLPVVGQTADKASGEVGKCLAAGMASVLTKPFGIDLLVATVRAVTGRA